MATFKNIRQLALISALLMAIIAVLALGVVTTNASSGELEQTTERAESAQREARSAPGNTNLHHRPEWGARVRPTDAD